MVTGTSAPLSPVLTPRGRLLLAQVDNAPALSSDLSRRLQDAFARGHGYGLLQLGAGEAGTVLPPVYAYWRESARSSPRSRRRRWSSRSSAR